MEKPQPRLFLQSTFPQTDEHLLEFPNITLKLQ